MQVLGRNNNASALGYPHDLCILACKQSILIDNQVFHKKKIDNQVYLVQLIDPIAKRLEEASSTL